MLVIGGKSCRIELRSAPIIHRCEFTWRWSPAPLSDFDLWCVISGGGEITLNGTLHPATPGHCFLFRPGDRVHGRHNSRQRLVVFACHFEFLTAKGKTWHPPELPLMPWKIPDPDFLGTLARWIVRCGRGSGDAAHASVETGLWQILLTFPLHLSPGEVPMDPRIERVVSAIEQDPSKDWDVGHLAMLAGLSQTHLSRLFLAATGYAPVQFVINRRLSRAKDLLRESDLTIGEIADALGYRDVYFFSRQFKRFEGLPPVDFRKASRSTCGVHEGERFSL